MVRSYRFSLVAATLLILTLIAGQIVSLPATSGVFPDTKNLTIAGWKAGAIVIDQVTPTSTRILEAYSSRNGQDNAAIETRCSSDPKDFLKWSGTLAYQGAGYEQLHVSTLKLAMEQGPALLRQSPMSVSDIDMRQANNLVAIVFGYIDHWGVHAESPSLWPRAIVDLVSRHPGPYCAASVAVPYAIALDEHPLEEHASAVGVALLKAILPTIARGIAST